MLVLLTVASFTKGLAGTGFPLIAVPAAALLLNPRDAVALVTLPNMIANLLILHNAGWRRASLGRLRWVLALGIPGTVIGAKLLSVIDTRLISVLLGTLTVVFVTLNLRDITFTRLQEGKTATPAAVGFLAGLLQGSTGASGPVLAMYLYSLKLEKDLFIYLVTVLYVVFNGVHIATLGALGLYRWDLLRLALVSVIPLIAGLRLGFWAREKTDQRVFNRVVLGLLGIVGVNLILDGAGVL